MAEEGGGGVLYHEVQESKLCALHCVNTVLQGPFFSEIDLAAMASDLDRRERQMMFHGGPLASSAGDFFSEESHNVSLDGDFSIQVLQRALEVWDLQVIPFDSPVAEPAQIDPQLEKAFICHLVDHWFCIRRVNGEWYNFDSLLPAPQHLSKFYLSAYLDSLKGSGWSIFLVRGNFPKECSLMSSEAPNGYGQWLTPQDAERINKSCSNSTPAPRRAQLTQQQYDSREVELLTEMEDEQLKAAIAASLMDFNSATAKTEGKSPMGPSTALASTGVNSLTGSSPAMAGTEVKTLTGSSSAMASIGVASQMGSSPAMANAEVDRQMGVALDTPNEAFAGRMAPHLAVDNTGVASRIDSSPAIAKSEVVNLTDTCPAVANKEAANLTDTSPAVANTESCGPSKGRS